MRFSKAQLHGATSLLRDGLRLSAGDTLLLLHQDTFAGAAKCISEVAATLGIEVDSRTFNRDRFRNGFPEAFSGDRIPEPIPRGIALLMEWSEETTKGRLMFIKHLQNTGKPWRVASMPGVDLEGLASCLSDFPDIREKCRHCFAVLARSTICRLQTMSPIGKIDELRIPVGDYCPMKSTGEISEGSWGNFPSGETFTLPNPYKASGAVTLRGSYPNRPLGKREWIRFELVRGRMLYKSVSASDPSLRNDFLRYFFAPNGRPKSTNSNALAELGIGTNRHIIELTGKPVFDEKRLDTIHIAFGSNSQFNGPLVSRTHHDLTCTGATLLASANSIVHSGKYALEERVALKTLDQFIDAPADLDAHLMRGTSLIAELHPPTGEFTITYTPYRGDSENFVLTRGKLGSIAQDVIDTVTRFPGITIRSLQARLAVDSSLIGSTISGLLEYRVLETTNAPYRSGR